jgi:uncharacterized integral membrane protein
MRAIRRVLVVAVFVGLLVAGWRFAAQHPQPVQIDYLVGRSGDLALWTVLLGAFAAGAALAGALAAWQLARLGMLARRYRKAVARLELELHELRNLPLAPEAPAAGDAGADAALGHATRRGS